MAARNADAIWEGSLQEGTGNITLGSGAFEGQYSFSSRFEEGTGTNPEELLAAAHAGCFSMALSAGLGRAGFNPVSVASTATVQMQRVDDALTITRIDLVTEAEVPDIDDSTFQEHAKTAKETCIISRALASIPEITLQATLKS